MNQIVEVLLSGMKLHTGSLRDYNYSLCSMSLDCFKLEPNKKAAVKLHAWPAAFLVVLLVCLSSFSSYQSLLCSGISFYQFVLHQRESQQE